MMIKRFVRSNLTSQAGVCIRNIVASQSYAVHSLGTPVFARWNSTNATQLKEDTTSSELKDVKGFKGHDMLAPFTAGCQTTEAHPLVIEKSEGCYVYDTNGKKYLILLLVYGAQH